MKKYMFIAVSAIIAIAACTKEAYTPAEEPTGIPFTATIQNDADVRAITDNGTSLNVNWAENETLALIYTAGGSARNTTATITDVDGTGKATISATLDAAVTDGTSVTIIYPASAADGTTGNVLASVIATQDGTLSASRDVHKGSGTIKVESATASLSNGATLTAQYAICKFEIEDADGSNSLYVSSFVVKDNSDNIITTVTPGSSTSTLYVVLPATSGLLWFEAVSSGAPYVAKGTASLSAGSVYRPTVKMATIFNIIGANGKFYKDKADAVAAGTTAAAIIAYLGDDTAESGYQHGLAISMRNCGTSSYRWRSTELSGIDNGTGHQFTTYSDVLAAKESGLELSAGKDDADNYPAFYAAIHNDISLTGETGMTASLPSSGTSTWFLPSAFQWNQIMCGLMGNYSGLTNMPNSVYNVLANSTSDKFSAATGSTNCWFKTATPSIHTSSEYDADNNWNFRSSASGGELSTAGKNFCFVRAALAF